MAKALKFVLFLGSTRENRLGERVATFVKKTIEDRGHKADLFDPEKLKLPLLVKPIHFYQDKSKVPAELSEMNRKIIDSDAIIVVSAEYNHAIPPALSNLMDHFPGSSYSWKPSGIVCYSAGTYGGMRAAMQLRPFLGELGCISVSNIFGLPKAQELFDAEGNPTGTVDRTLKNAANFLQQVEWWAKAARHQRETEAAAKK